MRTRYIHFRGGTLGNVASVHLTIVSKGQDARCGRCRILFRRVATCVFLFLLALPLSLSGKEKDAFVQSIGRVKNSIVPVLCIRPTIPGQFTMLIDGTGFFINEDGYFLTAAHVIADLQRVTIQEPQPCTMAIYVPKGGWQRDAPSFDVQWFQFTNCIVDGGLDLATCKTVEHLPMKIFPVLFNPTLPADGTAVAFSGFPLGAIEPLSARGYIGAYRNVTDQLGPRELIIDRQNWPGSSGSPVYGFDGRVLGIVLQRGIGDAVGTAVARPSPIILSFLASNQIAVKTTKGK